MEIVKLILIGMLMIILVILVFVAVALGAAVIWDLRDDFENMKKARKEKKRQAADENNIKRHSER